MAIIKSAWEIALEKTKDLKVDTKKVQQDETIQKGRRLAAGYLNDDTDDLKTVTDALKKAKGEEKELLTKGLVIACLDNIQLPQSKEYKEAFARLTDLVDALKNPAFSDLLKQLGQFYEQYLAQQDQLTERAKTQYQPALEQKQAQLRAQYGDDVTLRPEQDPEFLKMLSKLLKQLDAQYGGAITNAKEQIRGEFGIV